MAIVLFAMIGAQINANAWYWICFWIYCAIRLCVSFIEAAKEM